MSRLSLGATAVAFALLLPTSGRSLHLQQTSSADLLGSLEFLIGEWEGTSDGDSGRATVHHEYRRILAGHFINIETHEIYSDIKPPRSAVHDDIGLLSFDATRQRIVLRRFHTEGFAVQYVAELSPDNKRIVFLSEATENLPTGAQIRETYVSLAADELEHTVELADTGQEFRVSSRAHLKKAK